MKQCLSEENQRQLFYSFKLVDLFFFLVLLCHLLYFVAILHIVRYSQILKDV